MIKELAILSIVLLILFAIIYSYIDVKRYEIKLKEAIQSIQVGQIYVWRDPFGSPWSEDIEVHIDRLSDEWVRYTFKDGLCSIDTTCENFIEEGWKLKI